MVYITPETNDQPKWLVYVV